MWRHFLACCFFGLSVVATAEVEIYEFESDSQRNSYLSLSEELRCPKCQNQNLADSNSEISDIMRDVIAEQVQAGMSEDEIKTMMVDRYGDFVLYKPPVKKETLLLWWAPIIFLAAIAVVFISIIVRRSKYVDDEELGEPDDRAPIAEDSFERSPERAASEDEFQTNNTRIK